MEKKNEEEATAEKKVEQKLRQLNCNETQRQSNFEKRMHLFAYVSSFYLSFEICYGKRIREKY